MKKIVVLIIAGFLFLNFMGKAMAQDVPELQWIESYNVAIGETITGPAIIEKEDKWVKVDVGESYTLSQGGHANFYEGNQQGLEAEYLRTLGIVLGDVNGDGNVDVLDVTLVMRYVLVLVDFTEEQKIAADVGKDGNIDILDVTLIMQYVLGITKTF